MGWPAVGRRVPEKTSGKGPPQPTVGDTAGTTCPFSVCYPINQSRGGPVSSHSGGSRQSVTSERIKSSSRQSVTFSTVQSTSMHQSSRVYRRLLQNGERGHSAHQTPSLREPPRCLAYRHMVFVQRNTSRLSHKRRPPPRTLQ